MRPVAVELAQGGVGLGVVAGFGCVMPLSAGHCLRSVYWEIEELEADGKYSISEICVGVDSLVDVGKSVEYVERRAGE